MSTVQGALLFATETAAPAKRKVRCLCIHEGQFVDAGQAKRKFTKQRLEKILAASNARLASGVQVPIYWSNHEYNPKDKVGLSVGPYELKEITEADLPDPNLTDLIGKVGLFGFVEISRDDAIEAYDAKRIKPISVGIDNSGTYFPKDAIYEISLPGFGAIEGAQLFSKGGSMPDFKKMAAEALAIAADMPMQFGLTLGEKLVEEEVMPKLWRLFDAFQSLIREIHDSDEADGDKEQLIQDAIRDLATGLTSRLRMPAEPTENFSAPIEGETVLPTIEETDDPQEPGENEDMAQLEELQNEIALMKKRESLISRYSMLFNKARDLLDKGYLTPAHLKEIEAQSPAADDVVMLFAKGAPEDADKTDVAIAAIEEQILQLQGLEKFGKPAVQFGSRLANEPLPKAGQTADEAAEQEADDFLENYSISSPIYKKPA